MFKRLFLAALLAVFSIGIGFAQRFMDTLDRGLVAIKQSNGVYVSWRIFGTEYYGVNYNIYRDGTKLNTTPLSVSNYTDASGNSSNTYTVVPVINGVENTTLKSNSASVWADSYLKIQKATRVSNDGTTDITNAYEPNDATIADVDGDGEMEVIVKEINTTDANAGFPLTSIDFDRIEVYKLNGTLLWWIDCGPNLCDFQHNETNIAAYDWDMDGKAECVMRAADGTIIHTADGKTVEIGDKTKNYRADVQNTGMSEVFVHSGAEYLVYMNGTTGIPYVVSDYPLKRLEDGETDLAKAWGDGYGHRSSKHFFGAPYLDGKKPSIFLARGIYTRHKMIAYDVNPSTHALTIRWRWNCNDSSSSWYGQGYHNYGIADVDWDGRDEIVFGSMVIDDNGKGLSTTGLGHGDAQHCGDFDPYKHGQEIYACNETSPSNNYRDATTSKIYYRLAGSSDDGRSMCGNFTDDVPGAIGFSGHDSFISCVKAGHVDALSNASGVTMNFRTYWDGDLLEESFNGTGTRNTNGAIYKYGKGNIKTFADTYTNNDTKATPCFQGDIFGDWREEVVLRDVDNNIRIETTTDPTSYRNYTLLHDPQYRNGMVWQMCGYNQPPHVSYFLGKVEGITMAPPAPMSNGKIEISNGGTITSTADGKYVLADETGDATYTVASGVAPAIFFDNAPSWVQGNDNNNNIKYTYYTHTLTGGAFSGSMRLVKQGDGALVLPNVEQSYTGPTEVWAGTVNFDGVMTNSRVWLNRFAELNTNGGTFKKGIEMNYASILRPGGKNVQGTVTTDSLIMNFGSKAEIDLYGSTLTADIINAKTLKIEKKEWENGPTYSTPIFSFTTHLADNATTLAPGKYLIGNVDNVDGDISNIVIEGLGDYKTSLSLDGTKLYLVVQAYNAEDVTWKGGSSTDWDLDNTKNFTNANGTEVAFVTGDNVTFNDNATSYTVHVSEPVSVNTVTFDNSKTYTLTGDSIIGTPALKKTNTGNVVVNNVNRVGNTTINAGTLTVSTLANAVGTDYGSLGDVSRHITIDGGTLASNATVTTSQSIYVGEEGASISPASGTTFTLSSGLRSVQASNSILTKTGLGTLTLGTGNGISELDIQQGIVNASEADKITALPATVAFYGGTLYDPNNVYTYTTNKTNFVIPDGQTGTFYMDPRCEYTGKLTGSGIFNVYAAGPRNYLDGDWSSFTGTINAGLYKRSSYDATFCFNNTYGIPNATLNIPSGMTVYNNGVSMPVGRVTGTGTLSGTGTYTLTSDENSYFSAYSESPLIKKGSGNMILMSLGRLSSTITVSEGNLCFNNASASTLVSSTSTILNGTGGIIGRGWLTSLIMNDNSQLTPRNYASESSVGTIKTSTILNEGKNATINFIVASKSGTQITNSQLSVGSALTLNGIVQVSLLDTYTPAAGDAITLWTSKSFSGTPTLNLPDISSYGLSWDTSELLSASGVLKVTALSGISSITADTEVSCTIYSTTGIKLVSFKSVKKDVKSEMRKAGLISGTYIVSMQSDNNIAREKIAIE